MQCQKTVLSISCLVFLIIPDLISARILSECDAARELTKAKISRTFLSNWVCLMKSESGLDTNKISGPGVASSYSYGIFQISSSQWCKRGRKGGDCNAKCEDFANDDISDDIECAKKIAEMKGFQYWPKWLKNCKSGKLPNVGNCKRRRSLSDLIIPPVENTI
ncbi:lysozyme c-1-like [Chelonus insularis]|uniref:lysozyme c-1-like n=1 Tax=Chelonus insularis TaxID=460826 RepID=UPI00158E2798|nr:lysozyme c-1-like [Chelonus insularis]